MEVHHHPQLHHATKPWKEYLLEGLMIFLAVMMGFIAENVRETITNREHVKQLSSQLVRDLRNDTTSLQENILYETRLGKRIDSLVALLQQPANKIDKKEMQRLVGKVYNLKLFYPSLGAITAIKNELHIRQFSNSKISLYITNYEAMAHVLKELEDVQAQNLTNDIKSFFKDHFTPVNMYAIFHDKPVVNSEVRNLAQNDITTLAVAVVLIGSFNNDLISYDKRLKQDAVKTIRYVSSQYSIEDE